MFSKVYKAWRTTQSKIKYVRQKNHPELVEVVRRAGFEPA